MVYGKPSSKPRIWKAMCGGWSWTTHGETTQWWTRTIGWSRDGINLSLWSLIRIWLPLVIWMHAATGTTSITPIMDMVGMIVEWSPLWHRQDIVGTLDACRTMEIRTGILTRDHQSLSHYIKRSLILPHRRTGVANHPGREGRASWESRIFWILRA